MKRESTRTLLFGVLVVAGKKLTARQLIHLARPFRISATNVKSHLSRMVREGVLERSGNPRLAAYWPSASQSTVVRGISARLAGEAQRAWDGSWLILAIRMPAKRAARDRLRALLWFDGFRPWTPTTFLRPAWPLPWAMDQVRRHLASLPGHGLAGRVTCEVGVPGAGMLYRLDELDRAARRLVATIDGFDCRTVRGADAFRMRLRIGGSVARLMGHDPRLPPALWGGRTGMHRLVGAYRRFEAQIAPLGDRYLNEVINSTGPANADEDA